MVAALRIVVVVMFVVADVVVVVVLLLEQIIHDMVEQNMWIALILSRYRQKARSSLLLLIRQLRLLVLRLQMRMLMLRLIFTFMTDITFITHITFNAERDIRMNESST